MPIFESGRKSRYTLAEAAHILFCRSTESATCQCHPLRVRENAAFLVNTSSYKDWEDIKDDMNGAFTKVFRCCVWTVEINNPNDEFDFTVVSRRAETLRGENQYHLQINSKGNKACPALTRSIFLLKDASSQLVHETALVQYHIESGEDKVEFQVLSHGNSRRGSTKPYYPTSKSMLQEIKQQVTKQPQAHVYKVVKEQGGGPSRARSPGVLPRSRKQIYNISAQAKNAVDPVDDLLVYARLKEQKVVLRHQDMPTDLWVLGTDVMCRDLPKFTTNASLSHPLSIDPTFNMGQFEVTPVVYKHLFLTSKRTGNSPIFLGPTMIHHRKDYQTYKVFSSTCVSVCKGLDKCKGYITDGEDTLDMAWNTDLQRAKHLRCVKHFEGNCKEELRRIGIREKKTQKFFLEKVFGVPEKGDGIVDANDKNDAKERIQACKDVLDKKEILQKKSGYEPRFSRYLSDRQAMIGKKMSLKYHREAGMPSDLSGKPVRPYTNPSEAMNHVMSQTKLDFLHANNRRQNDNLSKVEFTRHVFEEIHTRQQDEFKLAVCELSEEYHLADAVAHLTVPVDTWFDWSEDQRNEYVTKVNSMSVEDALQGKVVNIRDASEVVSREFRELSTDAAAFLKEKELCHEDVVSAVIDGALTLLNSPAAIQEKASLDARNANRYEVASRQAKHGKVECLVNKNHVTCRCPSFKYDSVCQHSIAVAEVGILEQHLNFICKGAHRAGRRSALAKANVNKAVPGKKGSACRFPYRPPPSAHQ